MKDLVETKRKQVSIVYRCFFCYTLSKEMILMRYLINLVLLIITVVLVVGCQSKTNLSCPDGYDIEMNKCYKFIRKSPTITKKCKEGELTEEGKCIETLIEDVKTEYICPKSYTLNTYQKCEKIIYKDPEKIIKCNQAGISGPAIVKDGKCVIKGTCFSIISCTEDTVYEPSSISYICDLDYYLNSDNKCENKVIVDSTTAKKCSNDYELKDNSCIRLVEEDPIDHYICEKEYELKENECIKKEIVSPIKK